MNMQIAKKIKDPKLANDRNTDSAHMSLIVMITQLLKTIRLIVLIICLSYFTGLGWYIYCSYSLSLFDDPDQTFFISEFKI